MECAFSGADSRHSPDTKLSALNKFLLSTLEIIGLNYNQGYSGSWTTVTKTTLSGATQSFNSPTVSFSDLYVYIANHI